jgi:hypothetical protein
LDEPADALLSIARLSLIFDNAVFFVTGCCEDMQFGKICLKHDKDEQNIPKKFVCLPIPPRQEFPHFILLIVVF